MESSGRQCPRSLFVQEDTAATRPARPRQTTSGGPSRKTFMDLKAERAEARLAESRALLLSDKACDVWQIIFFCHYGTWLY